jgi:uncharacterized protein YqgQ
MEQENAGTAIKSLSSAGMIKKEIKSLYDHGRANQKKYSFCIFYGREREDALDLVQKLSSGFMKKLTATDHEKN